MKKNIAVVGCGHWGKNLVRNFAELGCLYSICDPNAELARTFAELYEVNSLSFAQTITDPSVEGLVIAVPAPLHASLAIEAMNAGKHVFVEKPLAMNQVEAEAMVLSAKENSVQLMVGHLLQYHPIFMTTLALVKAGEVGTLRYIYSNRLSFGKVRSEEDVIWSFAPHDISMILSLVGEEPDLVNTLSANILQPGIADTATVHMEFRSGLKSHVSVSWLHPFKEQKLVVVGDSAMVVFDDTKAWSEKLAVYRHAVDSLGEGIPELKKSEVEYIAVPASEPLKNECQHFIDVVSNEVAPRTDGEEGLRVLKVLCAATMSQKQNAPVKRDLL